MKNIRIFAVFFAVLFALISPAMAATKYVKAGGTGDGSSWASASGNLKGVLDAAAAGDQIWVAAGTYSPGSGSADTFNLKKGVKLYGGFPSTGSPTSNERDRVRNQTILNGNKVQRGAAVVTGGENATTTDTAIDGFTITGGNSVVPGVGGGMHNVHSSPMITNCAFTDNTAG